MGAFATGITVVTAVSSDGPRGMTANAFLSLSLTPPLVIVCVQSDSSVAPIFAAADAFGVNILADDQRPISDLFASHGRPAEPMGGFPYWEGGLGVPLLDGVLGFAECRVVDRLPGGDHTVMVGEATQVSFDRDDASPLLFYRGRYRQLGGEV